MSKGEFSVFLDEAELTLRMIEWLIDRPRPAEDEARIHLEALREMGGEPAQVEALCSGLARVALEYMAEMVNRGEPFERMGKVSRVRQ